MSLPALNASLASAPPPAEYSRDLGGQSAGGSKFTEMVNALAGEDPQPDAHAAATPAAASPQDQGSSSESTSKANESPSIDSGLARLVYGAVVSPAFGGAASRASGGRGASASSSQSADDSTAAVSSSVPATQNGADANSVLAGLLYGALASPAATAFGQFVARSAGGESAAQPGASGSNAAAANGRTTLCQICPKPITAAFCARLCLRRPIYTRQARASCTPIGTAPRSRCPSDRAARRRTFPRRPTRAAREALGDRQPLNRLRRTASPARPPGRALEPVRVYEGGQMRRRVGRQRPVGVALHRCRHAPAKRERANGGAKCGQARHLHPP